MRRARRLPVVFCGNHDVGCRVLETLCELADVRGVVAHPPDPEDGARYRSVYEYAAASGLRVHRARGNDPGLRTFFEICAPRLLVVADYRYVLPGEILRLPALGGVNLHPSLLPKYRGRAPLNWAILRGEHELGLTAHRMVAAVDAGPILAQRRFALALHEDVGDALRKLLPLYDELTRVVLAQAASGALEGTAQAEADATSYPRRRPCDGALDFTQAAPQVFNLIRAVARPYPGAFGTLDDGRVVTIWKARLAGEAERVHWEFARPGQVCGKAHDGSIIRCGVGALVVREATLAAGDTPWTPTANAAFCVADTPLAPEGIAR